LSHPEGFNKYADGGHGGNAMALINKKHVTERETASYKLDRVTVELVRFYSEFIGSPQEHVVNEALRFLFRKDKDFAEWLKSRDKPDLSAASKPPDEPGKSRGRTPTDGPNASRLVGGAD
jgi:hypothetical protein